MKFVSALMRHETNTFSPIPTLLEDFCQGTGPGGPDYGSVAADSFRGTDNCLGAYIDIAEDMGAEIDVAIAACASPSGPVDNDAYAHMCGVICEAVAKGCDAVLLDLHGAMVTETYDDGEGELLRRIRQIAPDIPIAVALDFHTNFSAAMAEHATVVTGYRTYPHVDIGETGARAMRTVLQTLRGEVDPVISWKVMPMLTHLNQQTPSREPMKSIMDRAIEAEADGDVLTASVFGGFPLADIPHVGLASVIVADLNNPHGAELCDELSNMAWQRREDFVFESGTLIDAIAEAKSYTDGPVLLADHGENVGSGGMSDVMDSLEAALEARFEDMVVGPVWDPAAVKELQAAGIGAEVTIDLGGKTDMPSINRKGKPLRLTGKVTNLTNGEYVITGPMMTGMKATIGDSAVLELPGNVEIIICSIRLEPYDVGPWTQAGIDPASKRYILLKSRQHFRAGFDDIARHIVMVPGGGVCSSDYDQFDFKNIPRPIYPLDDM
jgi:microcystin degradation protein MlrC